MSGLDIAGLLLMAGVGGALGAAAAVFLAGARASGAYALFKDSFRDYIGGRTDPASESLEMEFQAMDGALSGLMSAIERLKRALRMK